MPYEGVRRKHHERREQQIIFAYLCDAEDAALTENLIAGFSTAAVVHTVHLKVCERYGISKYQLEKIRDRGNEEGWPPFDR